MCNPCGYTMEITCRYHKLLIYDIKRTTKIEGRPMGPFNSKYKNGSSGSTCRVQTISICAYNFFVLHLYNIPFENVC